MSFSIEREEYRSNLREIVEYFIENEYNYNIEIEGISEKESIGS